MMRLPRFPAFSEVFSGFDLDAYSKPPFSIKRWADWSGTPAAPILVKVRPTREEER